MYSYDLSTGGLSYDNSPPNFQSELSPQEIAQNANLYDFNQTARFNQQQMQYGGQYQQIPPTYNPYQQPMYMNPPSGYNGYAGNPAYQFMQQHGMQPTYQQPVIQDYTYWQPGINTGSTTLFRSDAEEVCNQLQMEMYEELEASYAKRSKTYNSYYQEMGYSNYYGTPYTQVQYYDPAIVNKYRNKINKMREEAVQARTDLNKHLSRLAHNYMNDDVTDEMIDQMYDGHMVTVTAETISSYNEQARFDRMVEIDPAAPYREHTARVNAQYAKYWDDSCDMYTFFSLVGEIAREDALAAEEKRRRDLTHLGGGGSTYRQLVRAKAAERDKQQGVEDTIKQVSQMFTTELQPGENIPLGRFVPMLNQYATYEDGTVTIHAPNFADMNKKEEEYQTRLNEFRNALYRRNTDNATLAAGLKNPVGGQPAPVMNNPNTNNSPPQASAQQMAGRKEYYLGETPIGGKNTRISTLPKMTMRYHEELRQAREAELREQQMMNGGGNDIRAVTEGQSSGGGDPNG